MKRLSGWVAGAVVLGLVVAVLAWALGPKPASAAYVVAPASRGTITQHLTLVGPVERDAQASLDFDTPGLVTAVHVRLGDQVTAGQQLATVDAAPFRLAVLQARAAVAQYEAQLDADLTAQASGSSQVSLPSGSKGTGGSTSGTGSVPGGPGTGSGGSTTGSGGSTTPTTPPAYLTDMQAALTALQVEIGKQQAACTPVFAALQRLQDLLPTASPTASAAPSASAGSSTSASAGSSASSAGASSSSSAGHRSSTSALPLPSVSSSASVPPSTSPTATPTSGLPADVYERLAGMVGQVQACTTSLGAVAAAEAQAAAAITAAAQGLAEANQQAAAALAQAQAELQRAAQAASEEAIRQAQAQLQAQLAASYGGAVTDATIASDRARLLQARQQLASAESNLAQTTLTAPISGTVGQLDLAVGESSSGRTVTVVGQGAARVTVDVPLSVRALVAPGTKAGVGQLAADHALTGQVTSVSILPTSSSGTPSYAAVILADDPASLLKVGSYAEATLELPGVSDVLTVPMSAVTKITDTTGTVEVVANALDQSAEKRVIVTGASGGGRLQVVSGLNDGDLVVLADRRLPVPGGLAQYQSAQRATASPTPTRR